MKDEERGYRNLASAIVLQAVKDYREAILYNDESMMLRCERFFKSRWCAFLSRMNGENLAEKLRSETLEFKSKAFIAFDEKQKQNDTAPTEKAFKCPTCGEWVDVTYGYISRSARTKGYIAKCKSCGLNVKRKTEGDIMRRKWRY